MSTTEKLATESNPTGIVEWVWQSNPDPWSDSEKPEWTHYSDIESLIIEEAYIAKQTYVKFDDYHIDIKEEVQISNYNENKQRPIKRAIRKKGEERMREERFMPDPSAPKRPSGCEYGWVSPFILETRKSLKLVHGQMPSNDDTIVPFIVEKAAAGIMEEGRNLRKLYEAKKISDILMATKNAGITQVWTCCAKLYSMESFLYTTINETMRSIGNERHELVWRGKVRTLGPFCLLLWDDPCNSKLTANKTLYRVGKLTDDQIAIYQEMSKNPTEERSFQAFTSCSRDSHIADVYPNANALFIMEVVFAFSADLKPVSFYPEEDEELITPGVCYTVTNMKFDETKKKHIIHLKLTQPFSSM